MTRLELDGGRHPCPHCDARFNTVGDKKRHLRAEHPQEPKR